MCVADAADDGGEHVGEFGADHQQPFGVGLGRGDLQQRDELAGGGQPVLDQAVVAELQEFLDPDPGGRSTSMMAQAQNAWSSSRFRVVGACAVPGPAPRPCRRRHAGRQGPDQGLPGGGERLPGACRRAPASSSAAACPCAAGRRRGRARAGPAAAPGCGRPCGTCAGGLALRPVELLPRRSGRAPPTGPSGPGSSTAHWARSR